MFHLSDQHRAAFRQAARESFDERTALRLRRDFPEETSALSEPALIRTIHRIMAAAEIYGFRTDRDLTLFLHVSFLLGEGFESEYPWAGLILQNPVLSPDEKAQELHAAAQQERNVKRRGPATQDRTRTTHGK